MIHNTEFLNAAKTGSIQDVVNAVVRASKDRQNLPMQLQTRRGMCLGGKKKTEKKDFSKVVLGTKGILKKLVKCHLLQLENILIPNMGVRKQSKDPVIGIREIPQREECMTEQCMRSKRENLLGRNSVPSVKKNALLTRIMKTTQCPMKSFGYVLLAISIYIINQNITVREQARKHRKVMRCSDPKRKPWEMRRNDASAIKRWLISNRKWQAGGKARFIYLPPGYNNDPLGLESQQDADLKLSLIDLEGYDESYADRAQARGYLCAA